MSTLLQTIITEQAEKAKAHFRHLHQYPEVAFEEHETAAYIAERLKSWGYEVTTGIGKTGVVGRLKVGDGKVSIGLRADTDALPVKECADLPYKSKVEVVHILVDMMRIHQCSLVQLNT